MYGSERHFDSPVARRGRSVLLVLRDGNERASVLQQLEPIDTDVTAVSTGSEALALLAGTAPEVMIVDAVLDDMTGFELCQRLRADAALATTYVIILHGASPEANIVLSRGADDQLRRPLTSEQLCASVRSGLRAQAHRRVLARRERRRAIEWLGTVVAHEINNPLSVALASMDCVEQIVRDEIQPEDLDELRELVGDIRAVLDRIHATSKRVNSQETLGAGAVERTRLEDLIARIREAAEEFERPFEVRSEAKSAEEGTFDVSLIVDATMRVIRAAIEHCSGEIRVLTYIDATRVAVLVEFDGAPTSDPEEVLEPRLASDGENPAQFEPGLSGIERAFAHCGGQIFARPLQGRWRFGLTLPVTEEKRMAS